VHFLGTIGHFILTPLYYAVSGILIAWHELWSLFLPHGGGMSWVLSIVGLSTLLYGIIEGPDIGWTAPRTLLAFGVAVVIIGTFAWWESYIDHPMLDTDVFKNPRFSAASTGITMVFFAMFGATFLLTSYLQFVLGYSPLTAGLALVPWALVMMITSANSSRIVGRFGTKRTVATGLTTVGVALLLLTGVPVHGHFVSDVMCRMMLMAAGMGLVMAPATESIMGSLPRAKAGVGSAVSDTPRPVGGALGVAIIGSVMSSVYHDRVASLVTGHNLSATASDTIRSSLGGAIEVDQRLIDRELVGGVHLDDLVGVHGADD